MATLGLTGFVEKATVELNLSRSARSARAFLAKAADRCKKTLTIRAEQQREGKTVRDMQSLLYHLVER